MQSASPFGAANRRHPTLSLKPNEAQLNRGVLLTLDRIVGLSLLIDGYVRAIRDG
jgi:hypothetical protein